MGTSTLMDFCTCYPEAVPLRRIDASTVVDALCEIFARLGLPEEILSDQGSDFMSTLTKRVMEILQVKQLRTSPYPTILSPMECWRGSTQQ